MKSFPSRGISIFAVMLLAAQTALGQGSTAQNLPLHTGDRVLVRILVDSSRSDSVIVQENGSIMLPQLGPLKISGVSALAIGDSVRAAYALLFNPVAVEVTPLRRVSVVGEVNKPDVFYLETQATIRDAIARAGGVDEIGREDPVILIRGGQELHLNHWRTRGDDQAFVQSGDVIVVKRESWFKRNIFSIISGVGLVVSLLITATR